MACGSQERQRQSSTLAALSGPVGYTRATRSGGGADYYVRFVPFCSTFCHFWTLFGLIFRLVGACPSRILEGEEAAKRVCRAQLRDSSRGGVDTWRCTTRNRGASHRRSSSGRRSGECRGVRPLPGEGCLRCRPSVPSCPRCGDRWPDSVVVWTDPRSLCQCSEVECSGLRVHSYVK